MDAAATARVVVEDPLLDGTGIHLSVLTQLESHFCRTVRLASCVQSEQVRLYFIDSDHGVDKWRHDKEVGRKEGGQQGHASQVADTTDPPAATPLADHSIECPPDEAEADHQDDPSVINIS